MEMKAKPKEKPKTRREPKPKMSTSKMTLRSIFKKCDDMAAALTAIGTTFTRILEAPSSARKEEDLKNVTHDLQKTAEAFSNFQGEVQQNPPIPTMSVTDASDQPETILGDGFGIQADLTGKDWILPKIDPAFLQLSRTYLVAAERLEAVNREQFPKGSKEANFRNRLSQFITEIITNVNNTKTDCTRSLTFTCEQPMSFYPFKFDYENYRLRGKADYAIWYGRRRDIDTNLVIFEAKGCSSGGPTQLLLYMAMVHKKRCAMGKKNRIVYGILAGPLRFEFYRIDDNSEWSAHFMISMSGSFAPYVPLLTSIITEAAALCSGETDSVIQPTSMDQQSD